MVLKSALKATIDRVLEEHEIEDGQLAEDLLEGVSQDLGEDFHDDTEEEEELPAEEA